MSMKIQLNEDIFPANLVYLRKKHGLSQISLARSTGISVHYIRGIEKGRLPSQLLYSQYRSICDVLKVSPTEMGTLLLDKGVTAAKE